MATAQQAHALVTYFEQKYESHYGRKPTVNRYKARWGFDSLLMQMPLKEAKSLVDYYFTIMSKNRHDLEWFFYNYEKVIEARENEIVEQEKLARLRKESKQRAEEWRKKVGEQGTLGH